MFNRTIYYHQVLPPTQGKDEEATNIAAQRAKLEAILKSGNTLIQRFLFVILFVHFTIIIPSEQPDKLKLAGENYLADIDRRQGDIMQSLNIINDSIIRIDTTTSGLISKASRDKFQLRKDGLEKDLFAVKSERWKSQRELETDKVISIPIISISVSQRVIWSSYMGLVLICLIIVAIYRIRFLEQYARTPAKGRTDISFPIWTVLIPPVLWQNSARSYIFTNAFGIAFHIVLLYVALVSNSALVGGMPQRIIAINAFVAIAIIFLYGFSFIHYFNHDWLNKPKATNEED